MVLALNPQFDLRNEEKCSYLILRNGTSDSARERENEAVTLLPPAMGYILQMIGSKPYPQSRKWLADTLQVSEKTLDTFLNQMASEGKKRIKTADGTITVPSAVLVWSETIRDVANVSPANPSPRLSICRPHAPINLNLMVTTRCTTNCRYCYAKRHFDYELSTGELVRLIDDCHQIGVVNLNLTGGDIFARKDWKRIVSAAKSNGYAPFLSTKTPLAETDIRYLKSIGITELQFSIDASSDTILSDLIGTRAGYVESVRRMFEGCAAEGISICARTVLCRQNSGIGQIGQLYSFLSAFHNIKDWVLTPAFFSLYQKAHESYAVDNESLAAVYQYINSLQPSFPVYLSKMTSCGYRLQPCTTVNKYVASNQKCYANSFSMSILASGKCTICEMLYENGDYLLGDIRQQDLLDIWNSPQALRLYAPEQTEVSEASPCHSCHVFGECKKAIAKRVCYVDIAKVNGKGSFGSPDPRCPKAQKVNVIL